MWRNGNEVDVLHMWAWKDSFDSGRPGAVQELWAETAARLNG